MTEFIERELERLLGTEALVHGPARRDYLHDSTEMQGLWGKADAIVCPPSVDAALEVVRWCYGNDVPIIPRGGGTGFAGGAVPVDGGVVCSLERLDRIRRFEPTFWRMEVEAGVRTGVVHERARSNGLYFPPDPGASEQSHIGGNIACNAGGPHSFKYGVTGSWVTGLEVIVAPGRLVHVGGPVRKDVAGYDMRSLFIGSEGTLGIVTAAWLKLVPAPETSLPIVALYPSLETGCDAVYRVYEAGLLPAALEYFDAGTLAACRTSFPVALPVEGVFLVLTEADGDAATVDALSDGLREILSEDALLVQAFEERAAQAALWRWRGGISFAVSAQRGGKMSEDISVPVDGLLDIIRSLQVIGAECGLPVCSWGHAGDGNVHATFLLDVEDRDDVDRALAGTESLFERALRLGGTISGEHGIGWVKRDHFARQFGVEEVDLQHRIKQAFDPKNLFNPGKKLPLR